MSQPTQKLRLNALIALVVGSMIGGGIFSCRRIWPRKPMLARY
jgi:hypothetical protein